MHKADAIAQFILQAHESQYTITSRREHSKQSRQEKRVISLTKNKKLYTSRQKSTKSNCAYMKRLEFSLVTLASLPNRDLK
jgi:hypothetical protein